MSVPITIRLQREPFDAGAEAAALARGRTDVGALVAFTGICRGSEDGAPIAALTLEHYPGMAEAEIARHVEEACARWPLLGVTVIHRHGRIVPGEDIVLVAAASSHREAAFAAAEFLMDYLKTRAPFWKQVESAGGKYITAEDVGTSPADMEWVRQETDHVAGLQGKSGDPSPKTARGRKTLRLLLDAAAEEFGEKGFHEASISQITQRAGVAIGSFYTYFDSKEEVFTALVRDVSAQVRDFVAPRISAQANQLDAEREGQQAFLEFARLHKEIYRIVDEAEFVDPAIYREHYTSTAQRIAARLDAAYERGEISEGSSEIRAWALMGMNVFLGLRFGVWGDDYTPEEVARVGGELIARGMDPTRS